MKLTGISTNEWMKHMTNAMQAVGKKSTIPVIENILVSFIPNEAEGKTLVTFAGTDLQVTVQSAYVIDELVEKHKVVIDHKLVMGVFDALQGQEVDVEFLKTKMKINSGFGDSFDFPVWDSKEFPMYEFKADNSRKSFTINAVKLKTIIERVVPFTGNDEMRPIMSGIFCKSHEEKKNTIVLAATDAHSLVTMDYELEPQEYEHFELVMNRSFFNALKQIPDREDVTITFSSSKTQIKSHSMVILSGNVDGRYPNYEAVIPKGARDFEFTVDREKLKKAIKLIKVASSKITNTVRVTIVPGEGVEMKAEDVDLQRAGRTSLPVTDLEVKTNATIEVGYNIIFLERIAKSADFLKLKFKGGATTALTVGNDEANSLYLLMPVMLTDKK